ncbi:signal transduction histidine kinase [Kibdelosporangium banguiense]|uniref:Signal transduction histidine kinase n=1 Tax=Kibdelosporangium banguiense TaxID=1365924 RepID=A0ABS4TZX0_9PSEU|nr:hypothetical protein [Kibdelosporangium banguiense]MBP2329947.1 signal transduction histidine kinase [Kibdelosporangium banguiense]
MRVVLNTHEHSGRLPGLATAGVVTGSFVLMTVGVFRVIYIQPQHAAVTVIAMFACMLVLVWHIRHVARGVQPVGARWGLTGMAVVVAAVLPVVGVQWLGALYPLAASALLVLRLPWSLVVFAILAVVPVPVTFAYGQPEWIAYFSLGVVLNGLTIAVPVRFIAAVRQLRAARNELAGQAVVQERVRIDARLRDSLGTALESIADTGDRAAELVTTAPDDAAGHLREVVADARSTLAEARRTVAGIGDSPLRAELDAAVRLLAAAGIEARLALPPGGPPDHEDMLVSLRAEVSRVLADDTAGRCVIKVEPSQVIIEVDR